MRSVWFRRTFVRLLKFLQLKSGDLISRGGGSILQIVWIIWFGAPFCISIIKVLTTQIHCHSLDFNAFAWFMSTQIGIFVFSFFVPIFIYFNLIAINQKYMSLTYLLTRPRTWVYLFCTSVWMRQSTKNVAR